MCNPSQITVILYNTTAMLSNLRKYRILLGSKSPRRRELLQMMRIPFTSIAIDGIEEIYPPELAAEDIPQFLSQLKSDCYLKKLKNDELIITADTLVLLDGKVLGKPASHNEAVSMLMSLSGKVHKVVTGVTIATHDRRTSFTTTTEIKFAGITPDEAEYYVDNFNPLDKAGAYGIQEWIGCVAVEKINGSFYNVMGLPVNRLYQELKLF